MAVSLEPSDVLYPAFLADHRIYHLVEGYWKRLFDQVLADTGLRYRRFYNQRTGSGRRLYDANPIFDAYFPGRHKLVRILQYLPEPDDPLFFAYLDAWPAAEPDDDPRPRPDDPAKALDPIPELVLSLALTRETAAKAKTLLRHWVVADVSEKEMEAWIDG